MRKIGTIMLAGVVSCMVAMFLGCEWESSSDDGFNTSKGAGATVNFSGVYRAKSGGVIVGNITQLVVAQAGNTVEVWDNNNSYYKGSVGSPGVVANIDSSTGAYPAGALLVQAQMNFSGKDEATHDMASFVGVVHAVAVNDVSGNTVTISSGNSGATNASTVVTINAPPILINNNSGNATSNSVATTVTTTYTITEANAQYVLDGNWVEDGNAIGSVSAISPASSGVITTSASTTSP